MTEAWAIVIAASVTGVFGLLGIYLNRFRAENRRDHAVVSEKLNDLKTMVQGVKMTVNQNGEKLTDHLKWHDDTKPKKTTRKKSTTKK